MWFAFTILGLCVFLLAGSAGLAQTTLHVAANGNDAWSGKLPEPNAERTDGPLATLEGARDAIRKIKETGLPKGGVAVNVRGGVYSLHKTLVLGPEDSGTEAGPIVYAAHPGEKVILKGSRPITGWKPYKDQIYQADLTGVDLGGSRFWELYYDGKRQVLARYPNFDPKHPRSGGFAYLAGTLQQDNSTPMPYSPWKARKEGTKTAFLYNPKRLAPDKWSKPTEARVHVWSWLNWNRNIVPIKSIDQEKHIITLQRRTSYALIEGNRFFIENVFEELDAPGEWYYDEAAKRLTFWPPDGKNPEGKVSVPVLKDLIHLQGNVAKGEFVGYIQIRGFTLAEARGTLISLDAVAHCRVAGCTLTHCGSTALTIANRSHYTEIVGCDISHVGGPAISLSGGRDWQHRLERGAHHNLISNNHVHHVGEGGNAWGAITLGPGCGGNVGHDNTISHNLVHDTPRQGITFNGFRNIVEYNHVHHTNQEQSDTGAIGMGSRDIYERGSVIRYNYVHDTGGYSMIKPGLWEYPHYCWGIYLDDYTSGVHVYGNIVVRTYLGGVMVHGGQDNVIENNIIVDGLKQQVQYSPIDSTTSGRTPGHPDKAMWLMKGTKLLGNIFCYRDEKARWINGRKWEQIVAESDRNLIWHYGKPIALNIDKLPPEESWAKWQEMGFDKNSIIADPLFVDPAKDDYRLRPESPALKLGFKPIPVEKIGLHESPDRASWPVADDCWREEHITHPGGG
ncbi:MAG: right-handed parallel beta-helix repeat-containing protein [Planctomycetes bacterium]|nr:right-handed parallel beta-helix repeat-containing protein [Planctomycetota bacterium]